MSVYKEAWHLIDKIKSNSDFIYAEPREEYGCYSRKGDNIWNEVKSVVETYGKSRTTISENGIDEISVKLHLYSEMELPDESMDTKLYKFLLTYTRMDKLSGYFTVTAMN